MKKSSFVEGTFVSTVSIFIVKIIGMLYVIPFYALVGVKGSALYAYAYNIYVIFLDISTAGLPIAISKIINEYDTLGLQEAKKRTYSIGKRILLIISIVIFSILILFAPLIASLVLGDLKGGNTIQDVSLAIRAVSFAVLVVPFLSVSKGYLQGHQEYNTSAISQIIEQVIRITIILVGCYLFLNVFNIGMTKTICLAVSAAFWGALVAYIYVEIKTKKIEHNNKNYNKVDNVSNKTIINKIISYSIPFIIINAVHSIYNFTDMVLISRTMNYLKYKTLDVEFITTSITTWAPKISMVITSLAMGMTISLIPTIVKLFTLKDHKSVNEKSNQALQIIIAVSLPMTIGISLLNKPIWHVFYGLSNSIGPHILAIAVFTSLFFNIYMINSSILQSINEFKLVYKSAIIGLLTNIILDVPIMILYSKIGIPSYLGASTSSIIGYSVSVIYTIYNLKKYHQFNYQKTRSIIKKLILPTTAMIIVVCLAKIIIPINYTSRLYSVLYITLNAIIGALIYLSILYKNKTLEEIFGKDFLKKLLKKLHLKIDRD